jgi:anti-sigma-K factor RskA
VRLALRASPHALTGAYALDAIDGTERERFERHLARCPACRDEVRSLQDTATRFALAVSARPPQPLKEQVMVAAAHTWQLPPVPGQMPRPEPGTGWARRLAMPVAAACLALAIVFGVLLAISRSQLGSVRGQQSAINTVLEAPGTRLLSVRTRLGGSVSVILALRLHELVFTGIHLRGLPHAEVYELWVLGPAGRATDVGLLARAASGDTGPQLATDVVAGDRIDLTAEPSGGTTRPTTGPIALISLPRLRRRVSAGTPGVRIGIRRTHTPRA